MYSKKEALNLIKKHALTLIRLADEAENTEDMEVYLEYMDESFEMIDKALGDLKEHD